MKMKFGAIVVDGRGKIGGHVASKNRAGAYLRTKVTPVNGQTVSQMAVRAIFTLLAQAWSALSGAARSAWNAAVADYARTDIFGDLHQPTGFNLHQRLNNNLLSIGVAVITTPPLPQAVGACVLASFTISPAAAAVPLTFAPTVPALTAVKVFATAPMSPGKSFVKSEYRQITVLAAATLTGADMTVPYIAKFGNGAVAGQKVFIKLLPINMTTGQAGAVSSAEAIVA